MDIPPCFDNLTKLSYHKTPKSTRSWANGKSAILAATGRKHPGAVAFSFKTV
jgi:hypothetical protein